MMNEFSVICWKNSTSVHNCYSTCVYIVVKSENPLSPDAVNHLNQQVIYFCNFAKCLVKNSLNFTISILSPMLYSLPHSSLTTVKLRYQLVFRHRFLSIVTYTEGLKVGTEPLKDLFLFF